MGRELPLELLSDLELRELLELPEGRDGLRYYMSKSDKLAFLLADDDAAKGTILEAARKAQREHHDYLARRRRAGGKPDRLVLIEKKLGGSPWRFVTVIPGSRQFRDEATGRKAKLGFILESVRTGARIKVTRSTVQDAHERLGLILGWPPPSGRPAVTTSHGEPTGDSLASFRTSVPRN